MIYPIYTYGQPVLRKVAEDIPADYPDLQQLIADMFETLTQSEGIGLAAPQIGKAIRLVVIDLDVLADDMPEYKDFRRSISCGIAQRALSHHRLYRHDVKRRGIYYAFRCSIPRLLSLYLLSYMNPYFFLIRN